MIHTMAKRSYYAVSKGHKTGVFSTWAECERHVKGYTGAVFKKFPSEEEARQFVKLGWNYKNVSHSVTPVTSGHKVEKPVAKSFKQGPNFYAVKSTNAEKPCKIFRNWDECSLYVRGTKGVVFKKFQDELSAKKFIQQEDSHQDVEDDLRKIGFTYLSFKEKCSAKIEGKARIYCDGSSLSNGKRGAIAGFGVHYSDGSHADVAAPLNSGAQTNNRAEICAVKNALETIWHDVQSGHVKEYEIHTDSEYVGNILNSKYRFLDGSEANADLVKELVDVFIKVKHFYWINGKKFSIKWVKGHNGDPGNERADELARAGAAMAR